MNAAQVRAKARMAMKRREEEITTEGKRLRDERDAPKKAKQMEPLIEKAMARKVDHTPPLPSPDYSFPAMPRQMAKATGNEKLQEFLDKFERDRAAGIRDAEAGIAGF